MNGLQEIQPFLEQYGYLLLVVVGFLEFAGVPVIAALPVLIVAGAFAAQGIYSVALVIVAAAAGAIAADAMWYGLGRWKGRGLMRWICSLSSDPQNCTTKFSRKVNEVGAVYLIPSKFISGASTLVAAAAGFEEIRPRTFALYEIPAVLLWAAAYTALGYVFASQVTAVLELAMRYSTWVLIAIGAVIVGAVAWRVLKVRMHWHLHHGGNHA